MKKRVIFSLILGLMLATFALPVFAAPGPQGEGGVHFGPYTLDTGDSVSGDLTVFGGPVTLREDSVFNGDLTVFGPVDVEEDALIDGSLVVMGAADIAGTVEGDVFSAGAVTLRESASIYGDVSAVGMIDQADGALIEGDIVPVDESTFDFDGFPVNINVPEPVRRRPIWLEGLWAITKAIASILLLSLLALMIASVWPQQTERAGKAMEEAPLTAFGVGLLVFLAAFVAMSILAITICLSPFAILGGLVVGVGVLFGWIALGMILGKRILTGIFNQSQPQTLAATVLGTALLTLVIALTRIFWPIYSILLFALLPLAAGAVALTRFGTVPYATQGSPSAPVAPRVPPTPPGPAPAVPAIEVDVPSEEDKLSENAPPEEATPPTEA